MNAGESMFALLQRLYPLKRSLVSDGYDDAIRLIGEAYPIEVSEFPSGLECFTWFVPEKWTCREAWVETLDGRRVIDYVDHALHVVEYSMPVDRVVSGDELRAHLHVHATNPDAVPYVFKFYERTWGFCCAERVRRTLTDAQYRVRIDSTFTQGTLKVGEWWLRGRTDRVVVLAAHLCHPQIANDDLSGVVVGLELMRLLAGLVDREYTYVFLLVPETIGSIAWLSRHQHLVPRMAGGLFLEMLGLDSPHGLARSYLGDTQIDRCFEHALRHRDGMAYVREFGGIVRNDELEFNAPSFRVPMLSLSRSLPPEAPSYPYPEYHTHFDSPAIVRPERLAESLAVAFDMLRMHDANRYGRAKFKAQVFCSRYGLFPRDYAQQVALIKVLFDLDGLHSTIDICRKHGLAFDDVSTILRQFADRDLVELSTSRLASEAVLA